MRMKNKGDREYHDDIYSNFDHSYDHDEEYVKSNSNECFGHYGWNFKGIVWYDEEYENFYEEVWCYHLHVETLEAESLEDLIIDVNDKYGWG